VTDAQIITINASLQVQSAAAIDYSTLMILDCNHLSFDRSAIYSSAASYTSVVPSGSNLRKALDSAFSATPRPAQVVVGRSKGTAILAPTGVTTGAQYDFTIEVADGATLAVSYTAIVTDDEEDVATALKADIDADSNITDHVTATVVGVGAAAVLELSLVTGDDDFTLTNITSNLTVSGRATEAASDSLTEVAQTNSQWTYIMSTDHRVSYQTTLAAAATVREKPYFTSTDLEEAYAAWDGTSTPDSNDIGALMAFSEYNYVNVMYHNLADNYPEAVRVTQFTYLTPGRDNFQYQTISGFGLAQIVDGSRALNETELFNLSTKNMSTVVSLGGQSVVGGYRGTGNLMASGVKIEAIAVLIYFRQELRRRTETLLLRFPKLAMNDGDIGLFANAWSTFLDQNVSSGPGNARALEPNRPYKITVPKARDILFEDKAAGLLQNCSIVCFLDPSIDRVILDLSLTYSDPSLEI